MKRTSYNDHERLIRTFDTYCGIKGEMVYIKRPKSRVPSVQIGYTFSWERNMLFGVPQGSVLGPVFSTTYAAPLGGIIQRHGLTYHLCADDIQLYMAFKSSDVTSKYDAISRTTGSWRSCLSLEVVSLIPAGPTIIHWFETATSNNADLLLTFTRIAV